MQYEEKGLPQTKQIGLACQIVLLATIADRITDGPGTSDKTLLAQAKAAQSIYETYRTAVRSSSLFSLRNQSILAHGTKPLDEILYKQFEKVVGKICQLTLGGRQFKVLSRKAQFPRLKFSE